MPIEIIEGLAKGLGTACGLLAAMGLYLLWWRFRDWKEAQMCRKRKEEHDRFVATLPQKIEEEFNETNAVLLSDETSPGFGNRYFIKLYNRDRVYLTKAGNFFRVHDVGKDDDDATRHERKLSPYVALKDLMYGELTEEGENILARLQATKHLEWYGSFPATA